MTGPAAWPLLDLSTWPTLIRRSLPAGSAGAAALEPRVHQMAHAYHQGHQIDVHQRGDDRFGETLVMGQDYDREHDGQNHRARGQAQHDCSLTHRWPALDPGGLRPRPGSGRPG